MLHIENLRRPGLTPTSLHIDAGECVALMGPSGAGKSLLLRAIADLDPNEGELRLNGAERAGIPAPDWRRKVGYLPAETGWWAPLVGAHFTDSGAAAPIIAALNLPPDCLNWPVERLSTGEKQRLGFARLLELRPLVYLLDEPTSALDPAAIEAVEAVIAKRLHEGAGILMTTHDAAQAARLAGRQLRIKDGAVSEAGP